jgi:molecular chaperone DnaK
MPRITIDYGIDLGTTNSSIAVLGRNGPEVIRNKEGHELTPSAVYIDRGGEIQVGKAAKDKLFSDSDNSACEFKRWMGTPQSKRFGRSGRTMSPEELSAEILKRLRQDAMSRGEEIDAAVITVPADFDLPGSQATKRAAELAGFRFSHLLMEPTAAALAYGFQGESEKVFWLVFDFGGGTFDAALLNVRDGAIRVVNHGGDNHLGGKDIDWKIVDNLLAPILHKHFALTNFHRGNDKWKPAFSKLKLCAEEAKVRLSSVASTEAIYDFICTDEKGERVELETIISRQQIEPFIQPLVLKAVETCRRVLREQRLGPDAIEKALLVGGPTLSPMMREMLSDPKDGLGIPLEVDIDPLTVVAQGAAVFAGGQKKPAASVVAPEQKGVFVLDLEYKPMAAELEPLIGGKIVSPKGHDFAGFTIEFANPDAKPAWRSGAIPISREGAFMTALFAERHRRNTFQIRLFDAKGNTCQVEPGHIDYTVSLEPAHATLPHHVGVSMANNQVDVFFAKGTPLPAKKRRKQRTTKELRKNAPGDYLKIPIVEGNFPLESDLNREIGSILIQATEVKRDVPMGAEVEITLEMDESRLLSAEAYIPMLDQEFPVKLDLTRPVPSRESLGQDVDRQKRRLRDLEASAKTAEMTATVALPPRDIIEEIDQLLEGANDPDTALTCHNRLLALKARLAELEKTVDAPALKTEAQQEIKWCDEIVEAHGTAEDKALWAHLRAELEKATEGDPGELRRKIGEVYNFRVGLSSSQPWWWVGLDEHLRSRRADLSDQELADRWFAHNQRAIANNDLEALKAGCRNLWALLPFDVQQRGYGGTTISTKSIDMGSSSV